jgi:adenosine/AMP kinase
LVVDGVKSKGLEGEEDMRWRMDFVGKIGYKLG